MNFLNVNIRFYLYSYKIINFIIILKKKYIYILINSNNKPSLYKLILANN